MKDIIRLNPNELDRLYGTDPDITNELDNWHVYRQLSIDDPQRINTHAGQNEQSPDDEYDIYEKIADRERRLVAPNLHIDDYGEGTAGIDDEIVIEDNGNTIVISADHATNPVRKATGIREGADHGTGGLGSLVAEETRGIVVVPKGRQTSNANVALTHPLKGALGDIVQDVPAFLSLHGMAPGKILHQLDQSEVHGVIGLGQQPDEERLDMANDIVRKMDEDFGLRFVVGNSSVLYPLAKEAPRLRRNENGEPITVSLAAKGEGTTTSFVRRENSAIPAMQLELSRSIRYLPRGMEYREEKAARAGVYLGWLATRQMCIMMRS